MAEVERDGWTAPAAGMVTDLLVEVSLAVRGWYPTASTLTIARDRFGIWMPTSVRDPDGTVLVSAKGRLSAGGALHALAAELGAALDYLVDLLPAEARESGQVVLVPRPVAVPIGSPARRAR